MIIKKKYTNISKVSEEKSVVQEIPEQKEEQSSQEQELEIQSEKIAEETLEPPQKDNSEFDINIEDIHFEQRQERREGTRRRGFRRSQDRNLISRAQEEAIAIKEAAKQEGYIEGINIAKSDIDELKNKLSEFYHYKDEVFDKVSGCILEIAVEIAKKIIKKEIENNSDATVSIIKEALEEVNKTENKITLKVMPKDVEIVREKVPEIISDSYYEAAVTVIPDNNIKDGGVIIETSNGIIDASIETQLEIVKKALVAKEDN